jgi:uncharacterized membrane protein
MRLFGHPAHPMLVHFPIALWSLGTLCDGLTVAGIEAAWPIGWLCLAGGSAAALPAMAVGLIDYGALKETAVPTATRHMTLMSLAWLTYLAALVLRSDGLTAETAPDRAAMAVGLAGFGLLAVGAWHGGQLVYRMGAGVEISGAPEA